MTATPWQEQIAYYRARAAEYDLTSYQDIPGADRRIAALAARLHPGGHLLEIACAPGCGPGTWPATPPPSPRSTPPRR